MPDRDLLGEFEVSRDALALTIALAEKDLPAIKAILDGYPGEYELHRLIVDGFAAAVQTMVAIGVGPCDNDGVAATLRELIIEIFSPGPDDLPDEPPGEPT